MDYVETRTPAEIERDKKVVTDYLRRRYAGPPGHESRLAAGAPTGGQATGEISPAQAYMNQKYGGPPKR